MDWKSVTDITTLRECVPICGRESIENMIEDKFINSNFRPISIPLPPNVSSTISISVSHDGNYFATTHGDHTVKVFMYHTFKLVREFKGHPRTPWTVKFHPKDSDKVASGCLGCQVLVWSIAQNECINKIRLEFSIISICFHPDGDLIAIASGTKLELWNWSKAQNSSRGGYNLAPSTAAPPITHVRNVRAVTFHPSGDYLFAAAPDAPRQANETVTYCSLFGIKVAQWLQMNETAQFPTMIQEDEHSLLRLTNHSLILPQIHLYSDGGIDITKDGEHLISCSRLFYPPPPPIVVNNNGMDTKIGLSPLSTTERMEEDEQLHHAEAPTALIDNTSPISRTPNPAISVPIPFLYSSLTNDTGMPDNNGNLTLQNQLFAGPLGSLGQAVASSNGILSFPNAVDSQGPFFNQYCRDGTNAFSAPDLMTSLVDFTREASRTKPLQTLSALPFPSSSSFAGRNTVMPSSRINHRIHGSLEALYLSKRMISCTNYRNRQPELHVMHASLFMLDSQGRRLDHNVTPLPPGWGVDDHLCIFKLQFRTKYLPDGSEDIPEIIFPQIVNARPLTGGLMRAITSVKWSPTNRHVLMGFGVRSNNRVQDHAFPLAACEILSTQSINLQTVKVVEDVEDEVNIAQFHPMPGYGVVYGTKRGKTRVFVLPK